MSKHEHSFGRVLTKDQVAKLLNVSQRTLSRWHAEGDGPPMLKIGRQARYFEDSVIEWLKARERKGVRST